MTGGLAARLGAGWSGSGCFVVMFVAFVFVHGAPAEGGQQPGHYFLGFVEASGAKEADVGVEAGAAGAQAAPLGVVEVVHRKRG